MSARALHRRQAGSDQLLLQLESGHVHLETYLHQYILW